MNALVSKVGGIKQPLEHKPPTIRLAISPVARTANASITLINSYLDLNKPSDDLLHVGSTKPNSKSPINSSSN